MAERDDGSFLSRWSRRKVAVKQGVAVVPQPPLITAEPAPPVRAELAPRQAQDDRNTAHSSGPSTSSGRTETPPPTLEDVAQLTKESDFSRFVAPDVDPGVKNAAMKKLFATDPHFNVMDGLDTYIDDYNKYEPIPKSMLRQMVSARALGMLDDELEEQPKPDNALHDENADLQLQPDDAAGQRLADEGAGADDADRDPHDAVPPRST
jgi:Protein of unknown function (DUF3306)